MDTFENPGLEAREEADLARQFRSLHQLFLVTLGVLIVFSGSVNIFLLRQVSYTRKDLENLRPQVGQLVAEYQKTAEPLIKSMVSSFQSFARANPDFNAILGKYNLANTSAVTLPAQATNPPAQ